MNLKRLTLAVLSCMAAALSGCASTQEVTGAAADLGEGKQEFEQYASGGNYRFQYTSTSADSYRTVLWRQGETLSDDGKDEKLVAGVVRSVFHEKFCKELKLPVTFADGSPAPLGQEGKWMASLRCANPPPPPPKPKPEKKKVKQAPKPEVAKQEQAPEPEKKAEAAPSEPKAKPSSAARRSGDGPVECTANKDGGFDCKPKR